MENMKRVTLTSCLITCFFTFSFLSGAETKEDLSKRVEELEKSVSELKSQWPSWLSAISFKGDFRYRYEFIDSENSDARHRNRIRARVGLYAKVSDQADVGIRFATGDDDPVSTNLTLDDGFTSKEVKLDLAYIDIHPSFISNFHLVGGKMVVPFYRPGKSQLIWDVDLNPEGGAVGYKVSAGYLDFVMNLGGFWVEENSSSADSALFGGQGLVKTHFLDEYKGHLVCGAGFFKYTNAKGSQSFQYESKSAGNTLVGGRYKYDYGTFEVLSEFGFNLKSSGSEIPISIFGHYVVNTATGSENKNGWLSGLKLGKCSKPGSWALSYDYRYVESDALVGAFSDSDFAGGGTDGRGHRVGIAVQVLDHITAAVSYFNDEQNISDHTASDYHNDYHRVQIDCKVKF